MRRSLKERFRDRSLLFITSVIIGLNMFFFVNGAISYFLLRGEWFMVVPIIIALFVLIIIPYIIAIARLKFGATRLDDILKDDLFFFSVGYAYTFVGLFIIAFFIITRL